MKLCSMCDKLKDIGEFYKNKHMADGHLNQCVNCKIKYTKIYRKANQSTLSSDFKKRKTKNIHYIFIARYSNMKYRQKGYLSNRVGDIMTKKDFLEWCYEYDNLKMFLSLYTPWMNSGYTVGTTPTIDRIDNQVNYVKGNIEWLSHSNNVKKLYIDRKLFPQFYA